MNSFVALILNTIANCVKAIQSEWFDALHPQHAFALLSEEEEEKNDQSGLECQCIITYVT